MELPNKINAIVPIAKITEYLLSEFHAVGKSKAKFFRSVGFHDDNTGEFQQALIRLAQTGAVIDSTETAYGKKYVVDGELETPNGEYDSTADGLDHRDWRIRAQTGDSPSAGLRQEQHHV